MLIGRAQVERHGNGRPQMPGVGVAAFAVLLLVGWALAGAGCLQTEVVREERAGIHLRDFAKGPGVQEGVNQMPAPVQPDPRRVQPIPLTTQTPKDPPAGGKPVDPAEQAKIEAHALLHPPTVYGHLVCKAYDPVSRRPLQVLIRALADHHSYEFLTDPVNGQASVDLPVGRVKLYSAAGEFFTPYTNQIDVQPGENSVEVLLTQVPELTPSRYGFVTLTLARSARQDFSAARMRCATGQPDWAAVLQTAALPTGGSGLETALPAREGFALVDGPGARVGCRFAGLGCGAPPLLATGPGFTPGSANGSAAPTVVAPLTDSVAPYWDDLYRLRQAGFLRLWLYPGGRTTDPELKHMLDLPPLQYRGAEGWLAAERGPGVELVTLGPAGEGEAEYFALLNRGLPVTAVAEPAEADPLPASGPAAPPGLLSAPDDDPGSYQALPPDLYTAALTPRTLIRVGQFTALNGKPVPTAACQWLQAGMAQVAYGPVLDWKVREFSEVVGYPAQPVPAADRLYHIDLTAFVGPGAPPECRSIQLIELLRNGRVVARLPIDRALQTVRDLTFEVRETARCWYMLRAYSGPPADNRPDTRTPRAHWRCSWSAPIHFAAPNEGEVRAFEPRELPVAIEAFRAVDGTAVRAEAIVTRGGRLVSKTALSGGRGEVSARVGDHILVGGPQWDWRETVVSPYENRDGDPWRAIDAEPPAPAASADLKIESAAAANARLSGLGLLCPLTPRATEPPASKP